MCNGFHQYYQVIIKKIFSIIMKVYIYYIIQFSDRFNIVIQNKKSTSILMTVILCVAVKGVNELVYIDFNKLTHKGDYDPFWRYMGQSNFATIFGSRQNHQSLCGLLNGSTSYVYSWHRSFPSLYIISLVGLFPTVQLSHDQLNLSILSPLNSKHLHVHIK